VRIILKILAAPFVAVLTIIWAFMVFVFCFAEKILSIISGIAGLLALVFFVTGHIPNGIVFIVIAFLISPVGIPIIAKWLIDKLGNLNDALKYFITT